MLPLREPEKTGRGRARTAFVVLLMLLALSSSLVFGLRSYRTFVLLQSAQSIGAPETSSIRAWMTIGYVAGSYRVPERVLLERLQLPPDLDRQTTLRTLAERRGIAPFAYVQTVQAAIAAIAAQSSRSAPAAESSGWLAWLSDRFLSAVLVYGYAALALTLFLGAIGLPVPTGVSAAVAGSLASQGHLNLAGAVGLAVMASLLGDIVGYGVGRWLDRGFVERGGRWFGFTPANRRRVQALFARWGGVTVLLTRTLVSHLSSVASLLAGLSRYRFVRFVVLAAVGRVVWTAGYFGLGYSVGADFEAASGFLGNLSLTLISIAVFAAVTMVLLRWRTRDAGVPGQFPR